MTTQLHSPPAAATASTLPIKLAIILTYMLFGALLNSVGAVNLMVVQTLGVARADAALLDAWKDLPIAITSFLVASLLPRLGLKKSMLLAVAAVGAACAAMPVLSAFWAIKLLFCTLGAGFALVKVSAYSMIGLVTHDKADHARFTNLLEGLFMVGVLGGFLLFSNAAHAEGTGWLGIYPWLAGIAVAAFVLLLISPLDEGPIQSPGTTVRQDLVAMAPLLRMALVVVFLLSAFLYVLIEQGISTWLPSFNNEVLHLPTAMSVGLAVIMPATTALGRLTSAAIIGRLGWFAVVMGCLVGITVLILVTLPLSRNIAPLGADVGWLNAPPAAYLLPLTGLLLAPIYPAINSAMLSALPQRQHAAMTGLIVVFSALGGTLGSFVTGRLFVAFDGATAFGLLLVPTAALALALTRLRRGLNHV
ncbi:MULTISPECIES: sugar MFS transporter [unclassified Roseateles]|uniref:MFS transporter n=1 Tax=unclassified Roseateles TaxID=2626991 RepID=UPI0006FEC0BA|nr:MULTISPECIES: MFS transporter [unclassified Roseateles]KQW45574.1 MFS transporter [Pelomonas sp. Root405]KRA72418.1 MFS transporter [Pelomonas sp. Root662]